MSSDPGATGPTAGALGPLFILSGPSGSGKSTVIKRLLATADVPVRLSVSATTRLPRPGETDGVEYHFWTRERFEQEVGADAFLEWAEVHGRLYGTLRREVEPFRRQGTAVILDIDVQGAKQVRARCPDHVSIFLRAPSLSIYEERLRRRGTESEDAIRRRVARAAEELAAAGEYDHQVINDDLDTAVAELRRIVRRPFQRGTHA
jgi:guanylate kinase